MNRRQFISTAFVAPSAIREIMHRKEVRAQAQKLMDWVVLKNLTGEAVPRNRANADMYFRVVNKLRDEVHSPLNFTPWFYKKTGGDHES